MGRKKEDESLKQVVFLTSESMQTYFNRVNFGEHKSINTYAKTLFERHKPTFAVGSKNEKLLFEAAKSVANWLNLEAHRLNRLKLEKGSIDVTEVEMSCDYLETLTSELRVYVEQLKFSEKNEITDLKKYSLVKPKSKASPIKETKEVRVRFYVKESFFEQRKSQLKDVVTPSIYAKDLFEKCISDITNDKHGVTYLLDDVKSKQVWLMSNINKNIEQIIKASKVDKVDFDEDVGSDEYLEEMTKHLIVNHRALSTLSALELTFRFALFGHSYVRKSVNDKGDAYVSEHENSHRTFVKNVTEKRKKRIQRVRQKIEKIESIKKQTKTN